ncbi:hypothetical protein K7711_30430 [Nocardia sp. CA2R105]|uniref:hypothetical protein n=1 Tax=Nocardia coffeae TaxID=2873381 RepID=UPI001CA64252|nr:hypothetical protein [Nocardia coffeae]MBY8860826.1 hypothetical protein [Nocardia coffeae]
MRDDEIDLSVTLEQYLQVFRQPGLGRDELQSLRESVGHFLDIATPAEGRELMRGAIAPDSLSLALQLERALDHALAERDAAEREHQRRVDIRARMIAAMDTLDGFMRDMPGLAKKEIAVGTLVLDEGFELLEGGLVRLSESQEAAADPESGALEERRAELEERMSAAVAARAELMLSTITALREALGYSADGTGMPWVIAELAADGLDVAEPFAGTAAILPECPLKDLLTQIIADAALARAFPDAHVVEGD